MQLNEFTTGQSGRIISFLPGSKEYRKRLFVMGVLPGTEFRFIRKAPLGDPIELLVRGSTISLRKSEADILLVEKL